MLLGRRAYIQSLDDEQLILVFKEKQWAACVEELYNRYAHLVYGVQLKYTKNTADAEDLTMECFEKLPLLLLKHEIKFFKGWLHTVARNTALAFVRKHRNDFKEELPIHITDDQETTHATDLETQLTILEWAVPLLKSHQKICIELFYLEQKSYEQIMEQTGYTFNEVKSYVQNGKRKLKILMEEKRQHESR